MRWLVDLTSRDASWGLAVDEVLLEGARAGGAAALRLWVSRRAVVVGRSQAWDSECADGVARLGIPVVRRASGGGTVVHYPGNLNVSLTGSDALGLGSVEEAFVRFGAGLVRGLRAIGVRAAPGDRCVDVDGAKVSGLAQARRGRGILVHGTVLVAADSVPMSSLLRALQPGYAPAGLPSRPRPTTTLCDAMGRRVGLAEAAEAVSRGVADELGVYLESDELAPSERETAARLERAKTGSEEWTRSRRATPS